MSAFRPYLREADYEIGSGLTYYADYDGSITDWLDSWLFAARTFRNYTRQGLQFRFINFAYDFPNEPLSVYSGLINVLGEPANGEVICLKLICQQVNTLPIWTSYLDITAHD